MKERIFRLFIGITLPAPLGATIMSLHMALLPLLPIGLFNGPGLMALIFLSLIAYVFIGIQSILYAFFMEFYVNAKVKNNDTAIAVSTIFGALSGLVVQGLVIGALVGLIMGIILRSLYLKKTLIKGLMWILLVVFVLIIAAAWQIRHSPSVSSWNTSAKEISPVIGELGGMPVSIPPHIARFVEYQDDPHFLERRKGLIPIRTYQSKLRSFGFEIRFPDMAMMTSAASEDKRKSTIFDTKWMTVGVSIEPYHDELSLRRILDGALSGKWGGTYTKGDPVYGLVVNKVIGYDEAKRYKISGNGTGDANIYYHVNGQGKVDAYITCSNVKHHAAPCDQDFILPKTKNTMVSVHYRIGFLPHWREIQESVSKVIIGFAVNP